MKLTIEKDVPIPEPKKSGTKKGTRYKNTMTSKIESMQVGDSIFFSNKERNALRSIANYTKKITGFNFIVRTVDGGSRIWRIE